MSIAKLLAAGLAGTMTLAHADANTVADGELAFHRNCAACHSLEKGQNRIARP